MVRCPWQTPVARFVFPDGEIHVVKLKVHRTLVHQELPVGEIVGQLPLVKITIWRDGKKVGRLELPLSEAKILYEEVEDIVKDSERQRR